ncbi:MAG: cupredoxin domain-containing protein [Deltaproteobacteria bacterium]|nr:cupredoxin domain-containing protein [Deltaproteobacteria bacterium]
MKLQNSKPIGRTAICAACVIITLTACESTPPANETSSAPPERVSTAAGTQRVAITAKAGAFEPAVVNLVQGVPAVLEFTRVADSACMNAVRMPWMEEAVALPMNKKVEIPVDTSMTGIFSYSCWMNMVIGDVVIDRANQPAP